MSKKQQMMKALLAASVAASLGGCATPGMRSAESEQSVARDSASDLMQKSSTKIAKNPLISKADSFFIERNPLPTKIDPASQLPPVFAQGVKFNQQAPLPLSEMFIRLSSLPEFQGIRFTVAQDVYEADGGKLGLNVSAANAQAPSRANADSSSGALALAGSGGAGASSQAGRRVEVMVSDVIFRKGTVAELLDQIATKTNLAWRYDGETVNFFRYESRIFTIEALQGSLTSTSTISSQASGGGSGGGGGGGGGGGAGGLTSSSDTNSSLSMNATADLWGDVNSAIQAQLSPRGRMSPMSSMGKITITDTPGQLRSIDRYIKDLNKSLGKQISFNVRVYSVENTNGDGYGIDWNGVWSTFASKYKINYQTTGNTSNLSNILTATFGNAASGATSNWNGSSAIVGALSRLGDTTLVTSTNVTTLNNIPAPVSVTTEQGYLQSSSTTVSGTSGTSQSSLTPGTITTGFNMNLLPQVGEGGDLIVRLTMDLSDLVRLTTYTSPDNRSSIQFPQKNKRNFLQSVPMRSGETVILSGFQQTQAVDDRNGVGSPNFWGLGGSRNTSTKTSTLVIVITPYVMAK